MCDAPGLLLFVQFTDCPVTPRSTIPSRVPPVQTPRLSQGQLRFLKGNVFTIVYIFPIFCCKKLKGVSWSQLGLSRSNPCEVRCWTVRQMAGAQILKIKHNLKIFPVAGKYLW